MNELVIKDLHVKIDGKKILNGINLNVKQGEVTVIMGPNGSGKSTLAYVIMGHPNYEVEKGEIIYKGKNILEMAPNERSKSGLFLSFQYPNEVSGVTMSNFLRTALNVRLEKPISVPEFREKLTERMSLLKMEKGFANRYLNQGFSGGEKKRAEILQMLMLEPEIAILDETDSGLDIDALKTVANGVNTMMKENEEAGILLITHYQRLLDHIKPDKVYVMMNGKIVMNGSQELALKLEKQGYDWVKEEKKSS